MDDLLKQLFLDARTQNGFVSSEISNETLVKLYDLLKMAPTAANSQPTRFLFVKSAAGKERLEGCLNPGNVDKTMSAAATVIVAADWTFETHLPKLFPPAPHMMDGMSDEARGPFLAQNTALQAGYLILAARMLGLDCGPMGGFDRAKVDAEFLIGTNWRSNLLVNLGRGDPTRLFPRLPRLDFGEACKIL